MAILLSTLYTPFLAMSFSFSFSSSSSSASFSISFGSSSSGSSRSSGSEPAAEEPSSSFSFSSYSSFALSSFCQHFSSGTVVEPAFKGVEEESAEGFVGSSRTGPVAAEEGLGEGGGGEGGEEEEELHGWGVEGDCGGRWRWGEEVTSGDHHDPTHPR